MAATKPTPGPGSGHRGRLPHPGAEGAEPARWPGGSPSAPQPKIGPGGIPGRLPEARGRCLRIPRRPGAHPGREVPCPQELEEFDFGYARPLKREVIDHLGTLDFIAARHRQNPLGHRAGHPRLPGRTPAGLFASRLASEPTCVARLTRTCLADQGANFACRGHAQGYGR
jgi:hypothetical protein